MWSKRLTWIFANSFLLFGLPLIIVDNIGTPHVLGGLSSLSLGGFALAMAYNATAKGNITLQYSKINRAAQPRTFWATVSLVAQAGVVVVIAGIWLIFFKA